jgi:ketosteroid isomerase-like protein
MHLTKEAVAGVVDVYIRAWVGQDPDLITTVFTEDATYHERVMDDPVILGHDGIRAYWRSKVIESQAHISCQLLSLYLDGTTAIAEWEAEFDDVGEGVRKRMREVAILEFRGDRIEHLREYWSTQVLSGDVLDETRETAVSRPPR